MSYFQLLLFVLSSTLLLQFPLNTAQTYIYDFCLGGNYTTNSIFEANLNLLLDFISTNTSGNNNSFYADTVGGDMDKAYGLFQCRGDLITSEVCKKCAKTATEAITIRCPYRKEAIVHYDECWLHYSNKSFISTMQSDPTVYMFNTMNNTDPNWPTEKVIQFMEELVIRAISRPTNLFAPGQQTFPPFQGLYGFVQCTQDLSVGDCEMCLTRAISQLGLCCNNRTGGRVITPSCIARYEVYDFISSKETSPPADVTPTPPDVTPTPSPKIIQVQEKGTPRAVSIVVVVAAAVLSTITICICLRKRKAIKKADELGRAESLQFNFRTIRDATNNFSDANMLGKGGFGIVYQGILLDGQEIAVKRLSRNSCQGAEEFKNEVLLVVKLQHKNLVKLLGFCLDGDEKLLIYEFVPNASLDQYIFDSIKRRYLDWESRYKIIGGIARGLLYLHEDSRHRIIHRDLKAGNILLDGQMEPKISDFGLARLFGVDQTEASTGRIVGTYGYMAPEYAMHGQFSVKSDVFSFGVLILEIISGQKNKRFFHSEHAEDLAWRHWEAGTGLELFEPTLEHYSSSEVITCIHIGLLCVQADVNLRPTMVTVIHMLKGDSVAPPLPSIPAFFVLSKTREHIVDTIRTNQPTVQDQSSLSPSIYEVSMSELYPR